MLGPEKVLGRKKILSKKNSVPKHFWVKKICRGGSKLWAVAPWTIGSLHAKSWPPTMPGTLQKVLGGCGSYTKFSVLLWAKALVLA